MAEHLLFKVTAFKILGDWTSRVHFDDSAAQVIDFRPILHGRLFAPLRDKEFFARVRLDPECHTLVWPNGADFDPETLHEWPKYVDALAAQIQPWARAGPIGPEGLAEYALPDLTPYPDFSGLLKVWTSCYDGVT